MQSSNCNLDYLELEEGNSVVLRLVLLFQCFRLVEMQNGQTSYIHFTDNKDPECWSGKGYLLSNSGPSPTVLSKSNGYNNKMNNSNLNQRLQEKVYYRLGIWYTYITHSIKAR